LGHIEIVRFLRPHIADINCENEFGERLLIYAACAKQAEVIALNEGDLFVVGSEQFFLEINSFKGNMGELRHVQEPSSLQLLQHAKRKKQVWRHRSRSYSIYAYLKRK